MSSSSDMRASPAPKERFGVRASLGDVVRLTFDSGLLLPAFLSSAALVTVSFAIGTFAFVNIGLWAEGVVDVGWQAILLLVGFAILVLLLATLLSSVLVLRADRIVDGGSLPIGTALRTALAFLLSTSWHTVVVLLLLAVGFVLLIVPGVWLTGLLAIYMPVILLEGRRGTALQRCRELTAGYRWPVAGLVLFTYIVASFVSELVSYAASFADDFYVTIVLQIVLGSIGAALTLAAISASVVVAYRRLVALKEGTAHPELAGVFQ